MKVLVVFGTRPEAIKLAPVVQELRRRSQDRFVETVVCVTAQHREMLDQVLDLFGIQPDYDLGIMEENQTPSQVASAVLAGLERVLQQERPDWVVVQGDTTTVAAASLAAFYARVKLAHVEAGLRTYDKSRPFPEEVNRRVAGIVADFHFAPTTQARDNLLREAVPADNVLVTGNPVIDALKWVAAQPFASKELPRPLARRWDQNGRPDCKLILVTAHRRENFGAPLDRICAALRDLVEHFRDRVHLVYAVHRNPSVWEPVHRHLRDVPHITLTPPLGYHALVNVMKRSHLVLTDSGGLQEEAPALGIPVLVLREVTERPEAVEAGTARVVGTERTRIFAAAQTLLLDNDEYARMARATNPYGDGLASRRIASSLLHELPGAFVVDSDCGDVARGRG